MSAQSDRGSACECVIHEPEAHGSRGECLDEWEHSNGSLSCSRPAGHEGVHAACNLAEHPIMIWPREDEDGGSA